jgi:hypothetical protein
MKTILTSAFIAATTVLFLVSCSNEGKKETIDEHREHPNSTVHSSEHIFACQMHPEVIGKEGDKCPKCGMKLEHNDNAGIDNGLTYFMQYNCNKLGIESGKECTLLFTPKIKGKENEAVPLQVIHEKKLHLIVVSKDLAYFEHIHPEYQADGSYQIKVLARDTMKPVLIMVEIICCSLITLPHLVIIN